MKDCLEEHREDPGFSAECKEEFEIMMEARAADFRCATPWDVSGPALSPGQKLCCFWSQLSTDAQLSSTATDATF